MSRNRIILALSLGLFLAMNCFATPHVFMGFDEVSQRMFAVVQVDAGDPQIYAYCTLDQSNPGGWIDPAYNSFGQADPEAVFETDMSPNDPGRLIEIPAGQTNVITSQVDLYDANYEYLYTLETHDSLLSAEDGAGGLEYIYRQEGCDWVLPDTIRVNTAFCATICHGSRSIPIFCEDPNYNPDLLQVTVTPGCLSSETHCDDPNCPPVDPALFSWRKRVFGDPPTCNLFLSLTYCGQGPGCVCIWRSDFWLPVDMTGFDAVAGDGSVTINWSTASESQLTEFRVTRSTREDDGYMQVATHAATNEASGHSYTWVDDNVQNGVTYYYKLHVVDANGAHVYNTDGAVEIRSATPSAGLATEYALTQNYPNPFNSQTSFSFSIAAADHVTLKVFDLLGREVATVVDKNMEAGRHSINWSAEGLATGVYVYTLSTGGFSDSKKLLFLK
jgi:hypothetical protein